MKSKRKNVKAFTLIELIVVIAIIGILILLTSPRFVDYIEKTRLVRILNDIKVTENIIDEYLIEHDLPDKWVNVLSEKLQEKANLGKLYDIRGIVGSVNEGNYKIIEKDFLKKRMNTRLGGTFYANNDGKVYYEHDKSSGSIIADDDLFDREVEEIKTNKDKIKVLDYNFPNGIYKPGDVIKGSVKIEGIQAGTYTLYADIIHSKSGLTLNDSSTFKLDVKEIKIINFNYKVTSANRIGFYDLNVKINDSIEELIKYKVLQSIYIAQSEWEYFYEDDFYGVNFPSFAGIGALNPSKLSYKYLIDETYGFDYSSIKIDIDANDNVTGQAATILPITYGTYEASIKVPDNDALLNGFFLYGTDKYDSTTTYEIDMEILIHEGQWELWTTIYNESHKDYDNSYEEPGVIFQKRTKLTFDPSKDYHNYRINFYESYISFALDGVEVSRWNNRLDYGDMHMYAGTFYTHWLTRELSTTPLEMNVKWIRRGYFSN